jgi:maleylacetoacetate isomerase/maleylpyruvate isomerase
MSLDDYPTILRIDAACAELDAFKAAAPEQQPDAPKS